LKTWRALDSIIETTLGSIQGELKRSDGAAPEEALERKKREQLIWKDATVKLLIEEEIKVEGIKQALEIKS